MSACDAFCTDDLASCTGANAAYADLAACKTACATWPAGTTQSGNTLACRVYHLANAKSAPPNSLTTHCPHTSANGGGVCI